MDKLKPCPFCGGKVIFNITSVSDFNSYITINFKIECKSCGAAIPKVHSSVQLQLNDCGEFQFIKDDRRKAIEAWNRRGE